VGLRAVEEDETDYPELFDDVKKQLKVNYLDQDRLAPRARKLTEKALVAVENMVDEIYIENSDLESPHAMVHVAGKVMPVSLSRITNLDQAIQVLKDITTFIASNYQGKRTVNDIRLYMMNGFLSGLDPHTQVFNPKAFRILGPHRGRDLRRRDVRRQPEGNADREEGPEGTPAERAGFKNKDKIVKIGEESTVNMDVTEAVQKIRARSTRRSS